MKLSKFSGFSRQRGLSLVSLIVLGVILGALGIVAMRTVPTITEFMSVRKVAKQAASQANSTRELREIFDRMASINYVSSITGKDLQIRESNGKYTVTYAYEKEIPLFGPAYLLLKYEGTTSNTGY